MSKTVTIPSFSEPKFVCVINNKVYEYTAGATVSVPNEVADLITNMNAETPKEATKQPSSLPNISADDEGKAVMVDANGKYAVSEIPSQFPEMEDSGVGEKYLSYGFDSQGNLVPCWNSSLYSTVMELQDGLFFMRRVIMAESVERDTENGCWNVTLPENYTFASLVQMLQHGTEIVVAIQLTSSALFAISLRSVTSLILNGTYIVSIPDDADPTVMAHTMFTLNVTPTGNKLYMCTLATN